MGAVAIIGAAAGLAQVIISAKQKQKAQKAAEAYRRQGLNNVAGNLRLSTVGADFQQENLGRSAATGIAALQGTGARGIIGGMGIIQQNIVNQSRQMGADLDKQQKGLDALVATDQAKIRQMQEDRESADLAGLGAQMEAGRQGMAAGIGTMATAAAGSNFAQGAGTTATPSTTFNNGLG